MIDHDAARELAAAAFDFDLTVEDDQRLLAHLVTCESCRAFVDGLDADGLAIAGLAGEDAPSELRDRIMGPFAAAGSHAGDADVVARAHVPPRPHRLASIPRRYRGPLAMTAAAAVVIALVGGTLVWRGAPSGPNGVAGASPNTVAPSGSGRAPGGTPVPTVEPGSRIAASPWTQVAELIAADTPGGVVGLATGFRLKMLDGSSAMDAARRLTVYPPIAFTTSADADGSTVRITPTEPLTPGTPYRFSLAGADGREIGTWAFQAHQPVRVVGTVPADTETGVPLDSGIEVTFDQDGVVDAASHVTIEPSTHGRFEEHGRTLAFVHDKPLTPATLYTVTVSAGVEVGGTGERLEKESRFRFETAAEATAEPPVTFQFSNDLFESKTADRPIIGLWSFQDSEDEENRPPPPKSAPIEVYRIDGLDAAMDTYRAIRTYPRWTRSASSDLVPTTGLTQVLALDARLQDSDGVLWTELPVRLPAGWYLIHLATPARPIQAMLQVTDIASYLAVSDTKTLLWTNDLVTGGPLAGATAIAGGTTLGRTGADGTLLVPTPGSLEPEPNGTCADPCVPLIALRAGERSSFVPASSSDPDGKDGRVQPIDEATRYWHAFDLDRTLYRSTDTVNTWGVIRDRDTGDVPTTVTIALLTTLEDSSVPGPPLVTKDVQPNAVGAFSGSIALVALPEGSYELELRADGHVVASSGFVVGRILKPASHLDVVTGRRVYVVGDQIRVSASAQFYEGTPVPGISLRTDGIVEGTFKTDETGTATRKTVAHIAADDQTDGQPQVQSISVVPARAEEGEITSSSREIVVFESHWTISGDATVRDGRVRVSGRLSEIARDRLERQINDGQDPWSLDAAGQALPNRTVTLTVTDISTHRVQAGTRYDFIEKKVVPVYEYERTERVADTIRVRTDEKGRFTASIRAQDGHGYSVRVAATDPDRHVARLVIWAREPFDESDGASGEKLTLTSDPDQFSGEFHVGDTIDVRMSDPTATGEGATDRYLFYTAQRGIRDVVVQDSSRFRTPFGESAPPSLEIDAVRFNGSRFSATTTFAAMFHVADRGLTVGLSTDAARYAPGAQVRLEVTTRDRSGDPVAATVVLRAVDEKLFTVGGAEAADPLSEIYAPVDAGIQVIYRSHQPPRSIDEFGGGDTTGGGRDDFRDSLLFRSVDTGSDGRASVTMDLSDDLTSWRVSASAIAAGMLAGEGSIRVPVGLPFFADMTIAPEYLVSDRPSIGIRAFGSTVSADSSVTFAVDSDSLGLHESGLKGNAFDTLTVALPKLSLGQHEITVTARTGSGDTAREDRLTRPFSVVSSRLERTRTTFQELGGVSRVEGGAGLTEITVTDAGVGRYAGLLFDLADPHSARLENVLAGAVAASLARDRFATPVATDPSAFDADAYQTPDGGLAVVPYASSDLESSVLAGLIAPDEFDASRLTAYLAAIAADPKETRERHVFALAGLAGLGAGVLPELRAAAADPDLTIREHLMLGIGAAALGDAKTAHEVASALIDGYAEAQGDAARLRAGNVSADVTEATALMALLAAANDDPIATRFWAYVETNPDKDATYALHAVGFVSRMLDHAAPTSASFAYTIDGKRNAVTLGHGEAFHLTLIASQVSAFTVEPLSGRVAVTTSWREPVDPATFSVDPDVSLSRTITPTGVIGSSDLVRVDLQVDFGRLSNAGCHTVTDLAPSGLIPVSSLRGWVGEGDEEQPPNMGTATLPYAQVGQRVDFCAAPTAGKSVADLRYFARVISPGTYTWETAIAQSPLSPGTAAMTGATTITIR
jgi:hypothetical protein